MARVLITGGCGFFGTWILRKLLDGGHEPVVWDLEKNPARWEMVLSPAEIDSIAFESVKVDEPAAVKARIADIAPDAVIHLAGLQVPTCKKDPILGARVNVIGTLAIFEACLALPEGKRPNIVYASSAAVFGSDADYDHKPITDAAFPIPGTMYGVYKFCNEMCAQIYWNDYRLPSVGLRPYTVYGPGRDVGMTSFPTRAVAAALLGEKFDIPFSGNSCFIHGEEIGDICVQAATSPMKGAHAYTVGGDIVTTPVFIEELSKIVPAAKDLITCSGGELPIASNLDDAQLRADYPKVERIPLPEGIRRTVEVFTQRKAEGKLVV